MRRLTMMRKFIEGETYLMINFSLQPRLKNDKIHVFVVSNHSSVPNPYGVYRLALCPLDIKRKVIVLIVIRKSKKVLL